MFSWSSNNVSINKNISGVGYGLGATVMITKNMFIFGECSCVNFGKVTLGYPGNAPGVIATSQIN